MDEAYPKLNTKLHKNESKPSHQTPDKKITQILIIFLKTQTKTINLSKKLLNIQNSS